MHILIICQYYPPDIGGGSRRVSNAALGLEKLGHSIEVVTAFPHYPRGKTPLKYRRKLIAIESEKNRKVIRVWVPPIAHTGFVRRLTMYVTFSLSALFASFIIRRPDVIWAANTNIFSSFPANILSTLWRAPVVQNVDDLWPETAVEEGVLNRRLVRIGEALAKIAYSISKAITTISRTYIQEITSKYKIRNDRFFVAEVGVDTDVFHPHRGQLPTLTDFKRFRVLYSGSLGPGYDFDTIIEAANLLQSENDVEFIIRGAGECEDKIAEKIDTSGLTNITLYREYLEIAALVELLGTSDVLVLPMRPLSSHAAGIPTKLFEYMACGVPIICNCSGETKMLIDEARCGITVTPGNSKELAEAIMTLKSSPLICKKMGERGRDYAVSNYSLEKIGEKLEQAFMSVLTRNSVKG